jgi:hypothetical protein
MIENKLIKPFCMSSLSIDEQLTGANLPYGSVLLHELSHF